MGSANSPAISCRITNGAMRSIRRQDSLFHGQPQTNTWRRFMQDGTYHPGQGHGRHWMGDDGTLAALLWVMVDDFFIHPPTKAKCNQAFSNFMDHVVRMGFTCQKVKTSPPNHVQKFCGLLFDTRGRPRILLPEEKATRAIVTIEHALDLNRRQCLSRLSAAVLGGFLQSLVDASPSRQGQTCLRSLHDEIHSHELTGRPSCYTLIQLSERCQQDLRWWLLFVKNDEGNYSRCGSMCNLNVTWGDGSGTGTGGTFQAVGGPSTRALHTWMGVWESHVRQFDSNWRELRALLHTLQRLTPEQKLQLKCSTLSCFTDDMVTYFIVYSGTSTNPELHKSIVEIKSFEARYSCRVETIHVPGLAMISQGADGLSRGMLMSLDRMERCSVEEARLSLGAVPFTPQLGEWALTQVALDIQTPYFRQDDATPWCWEETHGVTSAWTPSPELARQAIAQFLDFWVESPWNTRGTFLVPRILQRDWDHVSRHIQVINIFQPQDLPSAAQYPSLMPFVLLYCSHFVPSVTDPDGMEQDACSPARYRWHQAQAAYLRGL